MKRRQGDVRSWLRTHGHEDVAVKIDAAMRKGAREGRKTRRNWWDVLAGDKSGNPRKVLGIAFPVLEGARRRQQRGSSLSATPTSKKKISQTSTRKSKTDAKRGGPIAAAEPDAMSLAAHRPKPFVKWAGGKRQLLTAILRHVPKAYGTYHEPFLGGGAVFFALSPPQSFLSDSNLRLVRCYKGIRNHVSEVISLLKGFEKTRSFFLEMRDRDVDKAEDAEVAAWFIFMNKMGFNGLYRVNSKNRFNVPFGDNRRSRIFDEENLRACSRALAKAEVECEDFSAVEERAKPGDLVYFDPPYVPLSATSYFTSYTAKGFTSEDQAALRDLALRLKKRDVRVILSNSSMARTLYQDDFSVTTVFAARAVNSRADRRGKITELLIS
jgi:DNA adenine methylase